MADRSKIPVSRIDGLSELTDKVAKAGDTMTGTLNMSGTNEIQFGTNSDYFYIGKNPNGDLTIYKHGIGGFYLTSNAVPHYWDGTKGLRLLTTADFEGVVPDYSAGISVTYPYTAPRAGLFVARIPSGADTIIVNGVNTQLQFNGGNSSSVIVRAGDVVNVTGNGPATCHFFPLKGV